MDKELIDPWRLELLVVRDGSHSGTERRALSRDVENGTYHRVRQGVYVDAVTWNRLTVEQAHVVRMRALAAVSPERPVFSHWSAALVLGMPVDRAGLRRLHVSGAGSALNGRKEVSGHGHAVARDEVLLVGGLLITGPARTVVDIAATWGFDLGVQVADSALFQGLPRLDLEAAADRAAAWRAGPRITDVVAFAHPGGESANESQGRSTMYRLGVEPPVLQHPFFDEQGFIASVDTWWQRVRGAGEADGAQKYLDPELAKEGAGPVVYAEKLREDRVRVQCNAFVRWGWTESVNRTLLAPVLARLGVVPLRHRPTLSDWAAMARTSRPRPHPPMRPTSRRPLFVATAEPAHR